MIEIQALETSPWASFWSWTGIPSQAPFFRPRMGCSGAGSGYRPEWAHPGARPAGGSKLNLHTRAHCGHSAWPWALPALLAPRKNAAHLAAPRVVCPWPRQPPHTQASFAQWASAAQSSGVLGSCSHFIVKGSEAQSRHRSKQQTRTDPGPEPALWPFF